MMRRASARGHRLAVRAIRDVYHIADVWVVLELLAHVRFLSWLYQRQEAVAARDQAHWARLIGHQQALRLAYGDALLEEDRQAARPKQRRLLAHRGSLDLLDQRLSGMLRALMQAIERRASQRLSTASKPADHSRQPAESVAQA